MVLNLVKRVNAALKGFSSGGGKIGARRIVALMPETGDDTDCLTIVRREQLTDELRCSSTSEGATIGLLALMTGISQEFHREEWHPGLEYDLWRAQHGVVPSHHATLLRLLHEECGGWWGWEYVFTPGPRFFTTENWLERLHRPGTASVRNQSQASGARRRELQHRRMTKAA